MLNTSSHSSPCTAFFSPARPTSLACTRSSRTGKGSQRRHPLEQDTHQAKYRQLQATSSSTDLDNANAPSTSAHQDLGPPTADSWELDFSSRPLLDERGKKKWELLICSSDGSWKFSRFFPNNKINSTQLRIALEELLSQQGAVKPTVVRFFRAQMQTIISRALTDLEIKPIPSRRCFALVSWLEDRLETVYKKDERFSDKASSLFTLDLGAPEKLPDNLRGERWSFVQLPLATLQDELQLVNQGTIFGEAMTMEQAGASELPPTTSIPGVAIYSQRSKPLSAWTKGYDLANLSADTDRSCLILETGVNQRWRYAAFRRSAENTEEAEAWEAAKSRCKGLHFLAVQQDEEADQCDGLWLLQDRELPSI